MKKIILLTLILVLMLGFTHLFAQSETDQKTLDKMDKLMEKVGKAIEKKDGKTAMKLIEEVLILKQDYAPALHQKARFFYSQDQAQAITLLERAVVSDNAYLPAVKDLASLHFQNAQKLQQTDPAAAAISFEKAALVKNLENAEKGMMIEALFNSGALQYQQKQLEKAIQIFDKLTRMDSSHDRQKNLLRLSFYMLGMAYVQSEQAPAAQAALRKYIDLSGELVDDTYLPIARFILAESLMNDLSEQVKKINVDQMEDKASRIAALTSDRTEIIELLEKAMAQKPELTENVRMNLGNFYYMAGNVDQAIDIYEGLIRDFTTSDQRSVYENFLKDIKTEKENKAKALKKSSQKK